MEILNVLNDFENEKINLFIAILDNPNREIEIRTLQEVMDMSRYKILSLIDSLNNDIKFLTDYNGVVVDTKIVVPSKCFSRYLLNVIKKYYFDLAPIKVLMLETLEGGDFPSFQKIEIKYSWSKSYFYQQKNKYEELLREVVSKGDFDKEAALRYFFYGIFDFFNYFPYDADTSLDKVIINRNTLDRLANTQRHKAELMLWIVKKRILNGKHISKNSLVLNDDFSNYIKLDWLSVTKDKKEELFLAQFYYYIGVFNMKNLNKESFRKKEQLDFIKINNMVKNKIKVIVQRKYNHHDRNLDRLCHEIVAQVILEKECYVKIDKFRINVRYFAEVYPFLDSVVKQIVGTLSEYWNVPDSRRTYFNIMLAMLYSGVPFTLKDNIKLCIDFSGGPHVNDYILRLFKSYVNINVEVSNKLTADTDLYLSDQYMDYQKIDQVIWIKPPTPLDWAEFGEKVVEIKQRKYYSVHGR
ncbi:hypothetical protein LB941_00470 [Ligilactobacillus sp. WILCCON 0076]|uniref:Mga helix-turn-helix domain-containing protein n=1 Tax=Ligilactobacillus ubinensis TaxID=2876789 RepID=A0A9X2FH85_9LACO|nr:hypothetical protein [Ligilactobacillus ubinensis]MCP0885805.1 hypothetical protein [Ligilactobacillus ubinensis]